MIANRVKYHHRLVFVKLKDDSVAEINRKRPKSLQVLLLAYEFLIEDQMDLF